MDTNLEIIKLLTEIKSGLKSSGTSAINIAIIAATAAIFGSIVASVSQYINAKLNAAKEKERQLTNIQVELIAKQRKEWMDSIRNTAAELIADLYAISTEKLFEELPVKERRALYSRAVKNGALINLKLNLNKDKQMRVTSAYKDIISVINDRLNKDDFIDYSKFTSLVSEFEDALRDVFEETWQRIKKIDV